MNRESLKFVLHQGTERELPEARPRALEIPLDPPKVVTLTGVRRAGKTFLMFETIRRLLEAGVDRRAILYLNLSDDRLYPIELRDLDEILPAHAELYPQVAGETRYLFLDEVQEVAGWERYVRRVYDTEGVRVFVTGSSSRLLTRDLAPALRGRSIGYEVFPLSFPEYVAFRGLAYREYSRESEAELRNALEAYVQWGGMPELVLADDSLRPLILQDYAALLFYRDIVERYSVRNEHLMRMLLQFCAARPAMLLSVHKLHRDLTSRGVSASKNTLYEYLEYLEDAYLVFRLPRHERSVRKQEQNPKKVYVIDPALSRAFTAAPRADRGAWLENLVFLHLRRRTRDLFYDSNGHEVDLVAPGPDAVDFYDVTWSLEDPVTPRREAASMAFGTDRYPSGRRHLIAHETGKVAEAEAAFRFLLGVTPS